MVDKRQPLGDVFREKQKQAEADKAAGRTGQNAALAKEVDALLLVEAELLVQELQTLSAENPQYIIKIPQPYSGYDLEESSGFRDLLQTCKDENVSISARRDKISAGLTERSHGYGTRPKMVPGIVITINASQEFSGFSWEEEKRHGRRPGRGPRFR